MRVYPSDIDKRCANIASRYDLEYTYEQGNKRCGITHKVNFWYHGVKCPEMRHLSLETLYEMLVAFNIGMEFQCRLLIPSNVKES